MGAHRLPARVPRSLFPVPRQLLIQHRHGAQAASEVLLAHPLVRRVGILAGETEAHQQHGRAKDALEIADHGDGAALARDHRLPPEGGGEGAPRGIEERAVEVGAPWTPAVEVGDSHRDSFRRIALDVRAQQPLDLLRILVRDEPAADLGHRLRRQYRLGTLTRIAA